jgi:F420-dependent oxidoreductase-like protein
MKLGLSLGYSGAEMCLPIDNVRFAERLGYDSVWTGESYGSDALTPLAFLAATTERIRLGAGIMQIAGRSPAMSAMQAQTIDALAGRGRMIAGLGVSGPQIVEGWYGQPWGKPLTRLRDYVEIMSKIFARTAPVVHDGSELSLPYPPGSPGASGLGKPLMSILHTNPRLPIFIGAATRASTRLAAELCDGVLPLRFAPGDFAQVGSWLMEGFERAGGDKGWDGFEIQTQTTVAITDDPQSVIDRIKPAIALYVGGMGTRDKNFHNDSMARAGYPEEAAQIQKLYLAGRKQEAIDAVPNGYVERGALIGSVERIRERYRAWATSGVTGLTVVSDDPAALELMAELASETPAIGPAAAWAALQRDASGNDQVD